MAKHTEFIRLVADGVGQSEAYRVTCGNLSVTSNVAKVKGSQLAKKYANEINQERERLKKVVEAAQYGKVSDIAEKRIMDSVERMEWLSKLADGSIKAVRPIVVGGELVEYSEEPSHSDRIKAIAELNKMDGSYAPTKTESTVTDTRPPSTITMPDGKVIEV